MPLADVDLADLDRFARRTRPGASSTPCAARTRCTGNPEPTPNRGFWAVTRHADICAVDRDPETFTSTKFVNLEEVDDDLMDIRRSMLETDGTRHRALRKLLQREFARGR